ncbi:MAG: GNAT family N-acetyltransferase, partial [Planctomycetes bacterium]|nr:GNAT family N-acetyltransferase [Planctomycetota bacterium]
MLSELNFYSHGYVAVPILESCVKRGVFELLNLQKPRKRIWLIKELTANEGYFTLGLQALESLGWIQKEGKDSYLLSKQAEPDLFSMNLTSLYAVPPEKLLQDKLLQEQFLEKTTQVLPHCSTNTPLSSKLIEGALVVPLLLALKQLGVPDSFRRFKKLPHNLRQETESLFFQKQWIEGSKRKWQLTQSGEEIFNKTGVLAIAASYRPMLFQMDQLLFGDSASVFRRNQQGEESHVDRLLNVLGSGFQHGRYFKDAEREVLKIFNQLPLKSQPKAIADMGCGDGSFLKQLYEAIKNKTVRGKHLQEFPLILLGIDYNRRALKATEANLQGLPYQTLSGDINDPDRLLEDLSQRGFSKGEDILHVRSFLDHNFSFDSSLAVDDSLKVLSREEQGWHVVKEGNLMSSLEVLSRWKAHFKSWAQVLGQEGLLVLEAHSLSPGESRRHLEASENFYFDTLHGFSHQYLISAESFVILAADVGLFSKAPLKRYPKTLNFCRITLNHFEKRDYIIRHGAAKDLKALYQLEKLCWKKELQTPNAQIKARIEKYPQGQFVLEKEGKVLGVIYSQRIESAQKLDGETSSTVHRLHNEQGEVIQLLAVNIHPEVQNQNLGDQLLEFMLQRCTVMNGVKSVLGVTLCKDYDSSGALTFQNYIHHRDERGKIEDPILSFHESHGATIDRALKGYRPKDIANEGFGVLICYDIAQREPSGRKRIPGDNEGDKKTTITTLSSSKMPSQREITKFLEEKVKTLLGEDKKAFEIDRPLMEMGLESADLQELQNQILENLDVYLKPAFFFQYNAIGKVVEYLVTTLGISKEKTAVVYPLKQSEFSGAQEGADASNTPDSENLLKSSKSEIVDSTDIAIVGISCKLPGGVETAGELWELLKAGESAVGELPEGRFQWPGSVSAETYPGIDQGGFIKDVASFDAAFFRISPKEAEMMDPQQRILLELSWSCLEDAGILPESLKNSDTGVFIGASSYDYARLVQDEGVEVDAHHGTGSSLAVLANRISYFFDFSGPSLQIDTACSSSLVAVHTVVQSLRRGECSNALVGGVNLICHPALSVAYYKAGMLAPDGRCKAFDASANGYVRSEGAVMIVLKPARKAIEERDFIYGVIKGSAINHGGLSGGLTVPNPQKQAELLIAAWKNAGIKPEDLSYLEAHGTGTSLGDPIELQGIEQAFTDFSLHNRTSFCGIGSLKSNLGHLEATAGIAGLLKIILSIQKKQLPSTIHFNKLNPKIELKDSP